MKSSTFAKIGALTFSILSLSGCGKKTYDYYGPGHTFTLEPISFLGSDSFLSVDLTLVSINKTITEEKDQTSLFFNATIICSESYGKQSDYKPKMEIRSDGLVAIVPEEKANMNVKNLRDNVFILSFDPKVGGFDVTFCYEHRTISKIAFALIFPAHNPISVFFNPPRYTQLYWMP